MNKLAMSAESGPVLHVQPSLWKEYLVYLAVTDSGESWGVHLSVKETETLAKLLMEYVNEHA